MRALDRYNLSLVALRAAKHMGPAAVAIREIEVPRHGRVAVTEHVHALVEKDRREACPQRTPEWYAKRRDHLTASLMATVCGANPYETQVTALRRKTGLEPSFQGNEATDHGNRYEMEAIEKYERTTGAKCIEFGLLESLNEGEEYLAGSPDGITTCGTLIEVKCPLRRVPTSRVPDHYVFQIQFLMHTLRLDRCDFIQYVPEGHLTQEIFIVTRVPYNPYFWAKYEPLLRSFWGEVLDVRARLARGAAAAAAEEERLRPVPKRAKSVPKPKPCLLEQPRARSVYITAPALIPQSARPAFEDALLAHDNKTEPDCLITLP